MPDNKTEEKKSSLDFSLIMRQVNVYTYKFFNLLILFLVILIFFISYQVLLKPKYHAVMNEEEINQKQKEISDKMEYLIKLRSLKKAYADISQEDKDKINTIINNTNEKEDLFKEMQYLAVREKLSLESLNVLPLDNSYNLENLAGNTKRSKLFDQVKVVRTTVTLDDVTYEGLVNALKTIEVNLRIMDVKRIDFDPTNNRAVIELVTYQLN